MAEAASHSGASAIPTLPPRRLLRQAWRDLKLLTRDLGAVAWTRPRLSLSNDGLAVVIRTTAVSPSLTWDAAVEAPLDLFALRMRPADLRILQRLARGEIRRSAVMDSAEWGRVQALHDLGLVRIERGDGWEAEITEAGATALRRGWTP